MYYNSNQDFTVFVIAGLVNLAFCILLFNIWVIWRQPHPFRSAARYDEWIPGDEASAEQFFALVSERLENLLVEGELPLSRASLGPRKLVSKRRVFSHRSVYLQVRYLQFSYYIYATPACHGIFVSTWLFSKYDVWLEHPILRWVVGWRLIGMTLFQFDAMRLFHSAVDHAVHAALDEMRQTQGLQPLRSYQRRPVLRGFYGAMYKDGTAAGMVEPSPLYSEPPEADDFDREPDA